MTRPCTCALGADPNCPRDHAVEAEREHSAIDEAKAVLFSLRAFREAAETALHYEELHAALHLAMDADDAIEESRIRRAIWNEHAEVLIAAQSQGYHRVSAAHRIKRMFQADEHQQFPERIRVRSTTFPARTGVSTEATGTPAAGSLSSDTRAAA